MSRTYYDILGLSADCTTADIKTAYRQLARKYHPDVNKENQQEAIKYFKEVTSAYETLSDDKKRLQYDIINGIFKTKFGTNFSEFEQESKTYASPFRETGKKNQYNSDFKEKFSGIFKKYSKQTSDTKESKSEQKPKSKRGEDINADITLTLAEVITGCKKIVNIVNTQSCPKCHGKKFINGCTCKSCEGKGEISEHKKITVTIPKGIKNQAKLRIKGEGRPGQFGGADGDLYLLINIKEDNKVNIEGEDLIYHVPISPFEAVLGAEILIPTFDGNVLLKIPPKTNSGQKFRLSGLGLNKKGDMIVITDIEISKSLSDDEIKLYEKLKKLNKENLRENLNYDKFGKN